MAKDLQGSVRATTWDALPRIALASTLCSAAIIEFTIPQVVRLSQASTSKNAMLPDLRLSARVALQARMLPLQSAITIGQFAAVREMRDAIDGFLGESPLNLSFSYGLASVPLIAAKYNLVVAGVYRHSASHLSSGIHRPVESASSFFRTKVKPGLLWSYMRDSVGIGGGIVLGPILAAQLNPLLSGDDGSQLAAKIFGGLAAGSISGLMTQWCHNTALEAGRITEAEGRVPGNFECLQRVVQEHGAKTLWLNFRYRVAIIATWTAILNVTEPFAK